MLDRLVVVPMSEEYAREIVCWKYPSPYEIYSFTNNEEEIEELLDGSYYAVLDKSKRDEEFPLVGYFCTGEGARVPGGYPAGIYIEENIIDLGLGIHPELTGQGFGAMFLQCILNYFKHDRELRLVVLASNIRARRLYSRAGFTEICSFYSPVKGTNLEFICMKIERGN